MDCGLPGESNKWRLPTMKPTITIQNRCPIAQLRLDRAHIFLALARALCWILGWGGRNSVAPASNAARWLRHRQLHPDGAEATSERTVAARRASRETIGTGRRLCASDRVIFQGHGASRTRHARRLAQAIARTRLDWRVRKLHVATRKAKQCCHRILPTRAGRRRLS